MPIPPHRADGTLPPVTAADVQHPEQMTPFRATLEELVRRFALSRERLRILEGFFAFRARLRAHGLVSGFQWIGGGFLELRAREPEDIDVVTFFRRPGAWATREDDERTARAEPDTFTAAGARARYRCDAFFVDLGSPDVVRWATYWCGLHSHQADTDAWKGFLEVSLAPDVPGDLWGPAMAERAAALGLH
jgi:hypothetical protein